MIKFKTKTVFQFLCCYLLSIKYIISSQTESCEKTDISGTVQGTELTTPEEAVREAIMAVFGSNISIDLRELNLDGAFMLMNLIFRNVPDVRTLSVAHKDENGAVDVVYNENGSPLQVTNNTDLSQQIDKSVQSLIFVVQTMGTQGQDNDTEIVDKFVSTVVEFLTLQVCGKLMQTFFLLFLSYKKLTCMPEVFFFFFPICMCHTFADH